MCAGYNRRGRGMKRVVGNMARPQSPLGTGFSLTNQQPVIISPTNYSELDDSLDSTHKNDTLKRKETSRRPSIGSCSADSGSESMIEMNAEGTPYVGIQVSSISGLQSYGIMVGDFGDELTLPVDGGSTQQLEAYKDKGKEKSKHQGKVQTRKDSVKVRMKKEGSGNASNQSFGGSRLSRDSGLDEQTSPQPVVQTERKHLLSMSMTSYSSVGTVGRRASQDMLRTTNLSDLCIVTVVVPADICVGQKGRGVALQFRFNPYTVIEYLRISILKQFHERFKIPVDDLSRLHLCRFSEEEEGWEWIEEEFTLQSYSLPRECKLDLKTYELVYHDVRVVVPHLDCTLYVEYDQFSTCGDILRQVLEAAEPDPAMRENYNLFHVRLRQSLDNNESLVNYQVLPNDVLECRVALGRLQSIVLTVHIPAIKSTRKMKVSLDETIGELISTLMRRIPDPESAQWRHMQLFLCPRNEEDKGIWLDDYKFLATYKMLDTDMLEFKPKYRPMTFELSGGASSRDVAYDNPEVLIGENTTVDSVITLLCHTCSLEYDPSLYGLYLHDEVALPRESKLWDYLDQRFASGYQDTLVLHLEPSPLKVQLAGEEESDMELKFDFSVSCRVMRDALARRYGVRNPSFYGLRHQGIDLNLELSPHDQGVMGDLPIVLVRHDQRVSAALPHEPPMVTQGEHTGYQATHSDNAREHRMSFLQDDTDVHICMEGPDGEHNLRLSTKKASSDTIASASFNKLVERLTTSSSEHDMQFVKTFLLSYQSFTTPLRLLGKLVERYNVVRPHGMPLKEFHAFRITIQVRVINAIKLWLETGTEFRDSAKLQDEVMSFVNNTLKLDHPIHCRSLRNGLRVAKGLVNKKKGKMFSGCAPPVKYPRKTGSVLSLFDFDPEEIARQMTITDFSLFVKIRPTELMNQAWAKPKRRHLAQNFLRLVERMNNLTLWMATAILSQRDVNDRARRVMHFAQIAHHLHAMHNYCSLMAILDGFILPPIDRLKKTFAKCDKVVMKRVGELQKVMEPAEGFKLLREDLKHVAGPCIPYMGLFTSDLTHLDDGNPNFTHDKLINFTKCVLIYNRIRDFMLYQDRPYNFEQIPALHNSLTRFHFLDSDTLYDVSLQVEPRAPGK